MPRKKESFTNIFSFGIPDFIQASKTRRLSKKSALIGSGILNALTDLSLTFAAATTLELVFPLLGRYSPLTRFFPITDDLSVTRSLVRRMGRRADESIILRRNTIEGLEMQPLFPAAEQERNPRLLVHSIDDIATLSGENRRLQTMDHLLPQHADYQEHAFLLRNELRDHNPLRRMTPFTPEEEDIPLLHAERRSDEPLLFRPTFPYGRLQHAIFTLSHRDDIFQQNLQFLLEATPQTLDRLGWTVEDQTYLRNAHYPPTFGPFRFDYFR